MNKDDELDIKGTMKMWSFDEKKNVSGWYGADNCVSLASGTTLGVDGLLSVHFSDAEASEYREIMNKFGYSYDLSVAPYISFDAQIAVLPEGVDKVELSVVVYSGDSYLISTGVISSGEMTKVTVPLANFSGVRNCDKMKLCIRGVDGTDIGEPTLLIGEISVLSCEYNDEEIYAKIINRSQNIPWKQCN